MLEFKKNTLGVISSEIVNFPEFLKTFIGETVTIWFSSLPNLYSIDKLTFFKFVKDEHLSILMLFGSNTDIKMSIPFEEPINEGFGIKIKGNADHYWIDAFNEKEAIIIKYNKDHESLKEVD